MTQELYWLTVTALMTGLLWVPYTLNRIAVLGLTGGMANPSSDEKAKAPWAIRAKAAHYNAVENLVVFAPLVIATHILGLSNGMTITMCMTYFFARMAHYLVYTFGIAGARTVAFAVGLIAQVMLALHLLGLV